MIDHLWQSTLFGAAAWLLTRCLRGNRAAVRYGVWLAASIKFLVPFSALMAVGARFGWRTPPALAGSDFSLVVGQAFAPRALTAATAVPAGASTTATWGGPALEAIWALGAAAVLYAWWRQWRRIGAALRRARPVTLAEAVDLPVRSTPELMEPGIVGLLRPVLLLPDGIEQRLDAAALRAIVAHECCHARRRDNLAAALHMIVEAAFWFHPLVWWIEARLVDERERACDEAVLQSGNAAAVYAEGILGVCRLYVESPLVCAAGVTGSNLKRRIETILNNRVGAPLSAWKKLIVASAAAASIAAPIVAGAAAAVVIGQAPAMDDGSRTFETASVRANTSGAGPSNVNFGAGGRFTARNMPLRRVMQLAFRIHDFQIVGKQDILDQPFDIVAKAEGNPRVDELQAMLRALLKERFKMSLRTETRELPVYTLSLARRDGKLGADLRPSGAGCAPIRMPSTAGGPSAPPPPPPPGPPGAAAPPDPDVRSDPNRVGGPCGGMLSPGLISGRTMTLTQVASVLGRFLNRVVVDRTGLEGPFDIDLVYTPDQMPQQVGAFPPLSPPADAPSLFTAVQEQLGLKLEPGRGPVPVLVIERVEAPKEN